MEKSKGVHVFILIYSDIMYHNSHISRTTEYIQVVAEHHNILVIIVII